MSAKQKWSIVLPVAALLAALLAVFVLDLTKGGAARPAPYLGESKDERYPYVAPTATPPGAKPTPKPTFSAARPGDPTERDAQRRTDLLLLLGAAATLKQQGGSLPTTNKQVQTLCAYQNLDQGCKLEDVLSPLPLDPLKAPVQNGYWYSSDGQKAKFYAALEGDIPDEQKCVTEDAELKKKSNVICVEPP